jgi:hypothetical protein
MYGVNKEHTTHHVGILKNCFCCHMIKSSLTLVLVVSLSLLSIALHLIITVSTMISRAKLRILRVVLSGVFARLSLEFPLMI